MLADSDMSPVSTLPLVLCALVICEIQQQLAAKEAECKRKDESNRKKDGVIREKDESLKEKDNVIREKAATIQAQQAEIKRLRDQLAVSQKVS